ncbi:MAG: response regulator transcription factor [Chloroflexi bacterium]|nr:response regulator transcription factor [Chloroflexota bacterium]
MLTHLAEGASNQEVADSLTISVNTVARHRENIMQKLNLHTRSELVKYAIRKGLIEA